MQINNGVILPDKAILFLTAIEDAEYKEDKIECESVFVFLLVLVIVSATTILNVELIVSNGI